MKSFRFEPGPIHVIRLERGEDIVDAMTAYADEHHIRTAWFTHLGAVSAASLRYYDQTKLVYRDFTVDRHLEVLSGVGNVSLLDGVPFVHTHAAFGDEDGTALGGHLNRGCTVFSLEVHLQELIGDPLERLPHAESGLKVWGGD
ncbi:MAG: PPC domain-containing DNA-binding protein [Actinomycetota bacterium]